MTTKPTISLVYDRKGIATEKRRASVEVRVAWRGKKIFFATGVRLYALQWIAKTQTVRRRLDAEACTTAIRTMLERVWRAADELCARQAFSLEALRGQIDGTGKGDALDWIEGRIDTRDIAETTRRYHRVMWRALKACGLFHSWGDFTLEKIEAFDAYVRKRAHAVESVANYHKRLKVYLADAMRHGLLLSDPYAGFKIKRGKPGETVRYLTEAERDRLLALKVVGHLARARDIFIFCCYTGLAYSDMQKVRPGDVKRENGQAYIEDFRQKTGGRYRIVLLPQALEVLERYDWQLPTISNQKLNDYLKVLALMAKIDKPLTSHMARHTFATWAIGRGVRIEVVSKMLGHADIATTQVYAKILQRDVDAGYEMLK